MCQAYEGEARSIASSEDRWRRAGWAAQQAGKPITARPRWLMGYSLEAFEHGWRYAKECAERGTRPLWPQDYE